MRNAVEIGSGSMMYIPIFIKIGSGIQTFRRGDTNTDKQQSDLISLFSFILFQNNESRVIKNEKLVSCNHFISRRVLSSGIFC
jgi:hypothetical protein